MEVTFRYHRMVTFAFAFGLLHGLGFAFALSEIGQLMFVAVVLAWVIKRLRIEDEMRRRVVPTYVIGTLATYRFTQRLAIIFVAL
jgi:hypothetical protein